ncbi:MAG: hypothetical protein L3J43_08765 [Sulfurovum sp.]|nr:hypothetical protein [Sulfurovum sp.]
MIRIFYVTLLLVLPMNLIASSPYAEKLIASSSYTVNLAFFKDKEKVEEALSKVPPALRKTIIIEDVNNSYTVKTLTIKNEALLTKLLPAYQKVFPDAFIDIVINANKTKENIKEKSDDLHNALQDKMMLYLCPEAKDKKTRKFLIEVAFGKKTANYSPILGKVPPLTTLYRVEDNKLFLFQKGLFNPKVYSLLEEKTPTYFLITSWVNGKKVKTLRYYFNVDDAKAYLDSY